jgi:hypothetical protein
MSTNSVLETFQGSRASLKGKQGFSERSPAQNLQNFLEFGGNRDRVDTLALSFASLPQLHGRACASKAVGRAAGEKADALAMTADKMERESRE